MKSISVCVAAGTIIAALFAAVASVIYLTQDMTSAERCIAYGKCSLGVLPTKEPHSKANGSP